MLSPTRRKRMNCWSWNAKAISTVPASGCTRLTANEDAASRFKLFTRPVLRETVFSRLKQQLADAGSRAPDPAIALCLAAGHTNERERLAIKALFAERGWQLWDEPWLREHLKIMADGDYENEVSAVVAKLLLRS
jgi:hypothetical protein